MYKRQVDGEDGWEKAQTVFPDLIISDIMMPRANGYALLEKIREDEKLGGTPVIFLTAKGMTLDRTEVILQELMIIFPNLSIPMN